MSSDRWTQEDLDRHLAKLGGRGALARGSIVPAPPLRLPASQPESAPVQRSARSKYGAEPCEIEGLRFDSRKEGRRYEELRLLEKVGAIRDLQPSPERPAKLRFELIAANGEIIGSYTPDFVYVDVRVGRMVVEDTKSPQTRKNTAYRLRKRLLRACHAIEIVEV